MKKVNGTLQLLRLVTFIVFVSRSDFLCCFTTAPRYGIQMQERDSTTVSHHIHKGVRPLSPPVRPRGYTFSWLSDPPVMCR